MRFIVRWLFRLLILVIVLAVAAVLLLDTSTKALMESRIRSQTGMDVTIGKVEIGLMTPTFRMEGFKLYNSAEFGGTPLIQIPEVFVEYDRDAAARQLLKIKLLRLNISEINVVQHPSGRSNLEVLQAQKGAAAGQTVEFGGIDVLNLSLGKMRFVDLKDPKQNREFSFGIKDEVVRNVRGVGDLTGLMLKIALKQGPSMLKEGWFNRLVPGVVPTNAPTRK